jgi:hypothetical protein
MRRAAGIRPKQNNPAVPVFIASEIVSLPWPHREQRAHLAGNRCEIDELRALALGDANEHMAFVFVSPTHPLFVGPPLEVGHPKDLQIVWVGRRRSVAQTFEVGLAVCPARHHVPTTPATMSEKYPKLSNFAVSSTADVP